MLSGSALWPNLLGLILMGLLLTVGLVWLRWLWSWQASSSRLESLQSLSDNLNTAVADDRRSWLGWWLVRAGYRDRRAPAIFIMATSIATMIGIAFAIFVWQAELVTLADGLLRIIPGGVGEVFLPLIWLSPLLSTALLVAIPAVIVRSARRGRVQKIEQDLPLTLDLLATLAEAGLGFDAALDRVLETQRTRRPLAEEFRMFQLDILAGRGRIDALRRLRKHIDLPWFSIFISSLIHAEQVGASLAQTLRNQADDLRSRRRERALALAMAIQVKLLFPLIICFLPGIMVAALGPIIYQIVQVLDQFLRGSLGR